MGALNVVGRLAHVKDAKLQEVIELLKVEMEPLDRGAGSDRRSAGGD